MPDQHSNNPTRPQAPKAILFDCDGTLLLTSDLHFKAISGAIARRGGLMQHTWYMARTGLGRRDLFAQFAADFKVALDVPHLASDSIALTIAMAADARENPLVADVARQAFGRLPIAVVTNSESLIVTAFLQETGLHGLFDCVLSCEDAARPKPAPDLYLEAAARLGVAREHCLVLEDSDQGIEAATTAGMSWSDVRSPDWPQRCRVLLDQLAVVRCARPPTRRQPLV
jgi:beta-phosphoglucomutase-like phosphatase (HAD superfamily)